jgi:hypothetical protein
LGRLPSIGGKSKVLERFSKVSPGTARKGQGRCERSVAEQSLSRPRTSKVQSPSPLVSARRDDRKTFARTYPFHTTIQIRNDRGE